MDPLARTVSDDESPDAPAAHDGVLARGAVLGRYVILDRLGEGGMGVVYTAYDPELDRKLAVKVVRDDVADRRARLLREAQALARLGHPNIVAVYDVGAVGDSIFIAMELVAGTTVAAWLVETPRDLRQIVDAYRQAGRGLAATHALGIVHRDFKPDNALIDASGRVRVVDFGLAAADEDAPDAVSSSPAAPEWERGAQLAISLTRTGAVLGTPGYIAPEGGARPAVDQFSFCVALWRALHGELPFAGDSATELASAAARGALRAPAKRTPAWLQRVLRRGLSPDPADRFPSMDALVDALGRRRNYAIGGGLAVVALAIAVIALVPKRNPSLLCRGAEHQLAGAWDPAAIAARFAGTNVPYAKDAASSVTAVLEHYQSAWVAMRTDACEATRVRGEQSEDLLDLRMACLDDRARELRTLGEVFAHADAKVVEKSVSAAQTLTPLADCANAAALRAPVKLPESALTRGRIEEVRGQVAEIRALDRAGKYDDVISRGVPLVAQAKQLAYRPVEANALYILGAGYTHAKKLELGQAALEASVNAAIAARDNVAAADAATMLIMVVGYDEAKLADAERWIARATAFAEAQPDERIRFQLANEVGTVRFEASRYDESLALYQQAVALSEKLYGKDSQLVAIPLDNIGNVYEVKGELAKSSEYHRRALKLMIDQLGPSHPRVAMTWTNLGASLMDEGKLAEARDAEQRALALKEVIYGKDSMMAGASIHELANVDLLEGHYADAVASFRRVVAIYKKELGPDHARVGNVVASLAGAVRHQHRLDEAEALFDESLAIRLKAFGPMGHDLGNSYIGLSQIAQERKQWHKALAFADQAVAVFEKTTDADSSALAEALTQVGNSQAGAARFDKAITAYNRALRAKDVDPVDRADTQLGLARALWETGEHAKAHALAIEAESAARAAGDHGKAVHDDATAWLAAHPDKL